jgi:hypothetical protein
LPPGVGCFEIGDLLAVLLDRVSQLQQRIRARCRRRVRPAVERAPRGLDGAVHVLLARQLHLGDLLAGGRVDDRQRRAVGGVDELAVDEVLELAGGGGGHQYKGPFR